MQILIAGGQGFVGSHLTERFLKEGHEVVVVDRVSDVAKGATERRHSYAMDIEDQRFEDVFRVHNIEIVVCTIGDPAVKWRAAADGGHCSRLLHLLALAKRYAVKKFLYLSSDAALRDAQDETALPGRLAEDCCLRWRACHETDLTVVRMAALYGPRQQKTQGFLAEAFERMARKASEIVLEPEAAQGDLLYIEDAVDAIYRLTQRSYEFDVLEIGSGELVSVREVGALLEQIAPVTVIYKEGPPECFWQALSPNRCEAELGWRKKYTLREGLEKTYRQYAALTGQTNASKRQAERPALWKCVRPYAENLLLFAIVAALTFSSPQKSVVNSNIGLDYSYVYILVMGLLYGKSQSIPAMVLSVLLLLYSFAARGADLVAVIYQAQHMMHLASYLLFGVLVGYVTDNKERAFSDVCVAKERVQERYGFLEQMYLKSNEIKERLYRQIVNSDDSLGRTYKILRRLDGIEVEHIFTAANAVVAEILGARNIAIYVLGRNRSYLRLKTRMGRYTEDLPNSLQVEACEYLRQMLEDRQVFVNRLLTPGLPDMAAPIFYDNGVIAVVQVYHLGFEDMSLNRQNQLRITAMLISGALAKAYRYEEELQEKRYVKDTQILVASAFDKIYREIKVREERDGGGIALLCLKKVDAEELPQLSRCLSPLVRSEDYVGLDADGAVRILLLHIKQEALRIVCRRFAEAGLEARLIEGDGNGR